MPKYRLSNRARADLRDIARYTFERWGIERSHRYNDDLLKCFHTIAESPFIGRPCDQIQTGYRRIEHASHVVFYRPDQHGVFIGRILYRRMLPRLYILEDS